MSNKSFEKLWKIEQRIRCLFPTRMWANNETIVSIRFFGGFELFNTRPYHNYETWSEGWEITSGDRFGNIRVQAEDLDDAYFLFESKMEEWLKEQKENLE